MPPRAHFIYLYAPSPYYTVYRACVVCIFPRFNIYRSRQISSPYTYSHLLLVDYSYISPTIINSVPPLTFIENFTRGFFHFELRVQSAVCILILYDIYRDHRIGLRVPTSVVIKGHARPIYCVWSVS